MFFLEVIFFILNMLLLLFSRIINEPYILQERLNIYVSLMVMLLSTLAFYIYSYTKFGMPPAAPKSDFSLKKKIAFLVFEKQKWDILLFLGIPFVFLVEHLERSWWFFTNLFVFLVALWLFRIINFERYLNEP